MAPDSNKKQFIYRNSGLGKITNTHPRFLVDEPVGGKQYGPKDGTIQKEIGFLEVFSESVLKVFF